jgi:hypothetical protein
MGRDRRRLIERRKKKERKKKSSFSFSLSGLSRSLPVMKQALYDEKSERERDRRDRRVESENLSPREREPQAKS